MTKYILFNEQNQLSARYDSEINSDIPLDALEVDDELFFTTINEQDGIWTRQPSGAIIKEGFPEPSSASLIAAKMAYLKSNFENDMAYITSQYSSSEMLSWSKQESEARAWTANSSAPTPLVDALAAARVVAKPDLISRIIDKADSFALFSGSLIGKRQKLEDQVTALGPDATKTQLDSITW